MKKILLLWIFIVALLQVASTQNSNSLLWKVSGNGLEKPSYLFGTYHLMPPAFLDSIPGFFNSLESVDELVVEVDVSDQEKIKSELIAFISKLKMPNDTSYADLLAFRDLHLVDSVFMEYFQTTSENFNLKPQVAAVFISQMLLIKNVPGMYNGTAVIFDEYIRSKGVDMGKNSSALETLDEQMKLLYQSGSSLQEDARGLVNFIVSDLASFEVDIKILETTYRHQDLNSLYSFYLEKLKAKRIQLGDKIIESADEQFLSNRNKNWVQKLSSKMKTTSCFVAVGALHLPGEFGVIELLKKQGFEINPVVEKQ